MVRSCHGAGRTGRESRYAAAFRPDRPCRRNLLESRRAVEPETGGERAAAPFDIHQDRRSPCALGDARREVQGNEGLALAAVGAGDVRRAGLAGPSAGTVASTAAQYLLADQSDLLPRGIRRVDQAGPTQQGAGDWLRTLASGLTRATAGTRRRHWRDRRDRDRVDRRRSSPPVPGARARRTPGSRWRRGPHRQRARPDGNDGAGGVHAANICHDVAWSHRGNDEPQWKWQQAEK